MRRVISGAVVVAIVGCGFAAHADGPRADRPKVEGVVNLNAANLSQLTLLPGVGPTKARRIIDYRQRRQFRHIGELMRVKGFGRKTFARLRPHLTVTGPTTIQRVCPSRASGELQPTHRRGA